MRSLLVRGPRRLILVVLAGLLAASGWGLVAPAAYAVGAAPTGLTPDGSVSGEPVFAWSPTPGALDYRIELSRDASFTSTSRIGSVATTVNTTWVPAATLPDSVWWRVNARVSGGLTDWTVASFTREQAGAPANLRTVDDDGTFEQPREAIRFSWDPVSGASTYIVEVSQDEQFVDPARTATYTTKTTALTPQVLPSEGTYYWRVRGTIGNGLFTRWSEPQSYAVRTPGTSASNPIPTEPEYPTSNETVTVEDVALDWRPIPGAASYRLQISTDRNFLTLVRPEVSVVSTRYSPPTTLNNDQYFWRVRAVNAQGKLSAWPESPWSFRRAWDQQPTPVHPAPRATVGDPVFFQWTPARLADRYTLQVSESSSFSGAFSCGTTVHTTVQPTCPLVAGRSYYWRVLAYDGSVSSEAIYSIVQRFTYDPQLVTLSSPTNGQQVEVPTLRWQAQAHATKYRVTVTSSTGRATTAITSSTSYTPTSTIAPGTYRWQVQSVSQAGQVGAGLLAEAQPTFVVVTPTAATASVPTLVPVAGSNSRFPSLSWTPVVNADAYNLQVRSLGSTGWTDVLTTAYPAATDTGTNFLEPDTYEWRVTAFAKGSIIGSSPTNESFVVAPFDEVTGQKAALKGTDLAEPSRTCAAVLPKECQDLRATPVLTWDAQADAAFYKITLSLDGNLTNVVPGYPQVVRTNMWTSPTALPDSQAGTAYYWSVVPCRSSDVCAGQRAPQHMFAKESSPVRLLSPRQADSSSPVPEVADDVRFDWRDYLASSADEAPGDSSLTSTNEVEAASYRIQIATDLNFQSVLVTDKVDQTTYTPHSATLPEGPLYWRVQAVDGSDNDLNWSSPGRFDKRSPTAELTLPDSGATMTGSTSFAWAPLDHARTYNLEIYKNDDTVPNPVNRVVNERGLLTTSFAPATPLAASDTAYRWRLQRVDASGRLGEWTPLRPFRVSGEGPTLLAPENAASLSPRKALFTWEAAPGAVASKYRFKATGPGGASVVSETASVAYAPTVRMADGAWTWAVTGLDTAGQEIGTSTARQVVVVGSPTTTLTVSGTARLGGTLRVETPRWSHPGVVTGYQWLRDGRAITGATSATYTVQDVDYGKSITVKVTGTLDGYDPGVAQSAPYVVGAGDPIASKIAPTLTGEAAVGKTLTSSAGSWSITPTSFTYAWLREGVVIAGATRSTYLLTGADAGRRITSLVTAVRTGYSSGTSASAVKTISKAASTSTFTLADRTISRTTYPRAYVTVTAPAGAAISGTVSVYDGTRRIKYVSIVSASSGKVTITVPRLSRGTHYLSVGYGGNAQLLSSRSGKTSIKVS